MNERNEAAVTEVVRILTNLGARERVVALGYLARKIGRKHRAPALKEDLMRAAAERLG